MKKKKKNRPKTLGSLMKIPKTKQAKYLQAAGWKGRAEWLSHLYTAKCREATRLRGAVAAFIAKVNAIPTPRELARRRK